jgi:hypothetical protein
MKFTIYGLEYVCSTAVGILYYLGKRNTVTQLIVSELLE